MNKLIIFDCDGVLVDSEIAATQYTMDFLAAHGCVLSFEECSERFTGKTINDIETYILKTRGLEISYEQWLKTDQHQQLARIFFACLSPLMTCVLNVLQQNNISRCVASNSRMDELHQKLQRTDQKIFFENHHIFSAQQVKTGKPAPDLFLFAADQMGYAPQDCLVIEDSPSGIEAAMAANMPVIGFLGADHSQHKKYQELIEGYHIPIVKDAEALLALIMSMYFNGQSQIIPCVL